MGRRGRRRLPMAVKLSRGTLRVDRDGDPCLAPNPSLLASCPPPPDSLGQAGRDVWLEIVPKMIAANYFTQLDLLAFERFCRAHDEVARCDQILIAEGDHSIADTGYVCQHPAVNQRFKWLDILRRYEDAFWLNPTARSGKQIVRKPGSAIPKRERA